MTYPHSPNSTYGVAPLIRTVPDDVVPERSGVTVWWSNSKREGEWLLPRLFRAFSCMGNIELDLMSARMGAGVSEIEVLGIFANIEIRVPPDIRVECEGEALAGNFELTRVGDVPPPPPGAPALLISGNAYFGSVTVKIMGTPLPGWKEKLASGWKSLNS